MSYFKNMSAPPKSVITFRQDELGVYYRFDPKELFKILLNTAIVDDDYKDRIANLCNLYIKKHHRVKDSIKKPTGFMIASKMTDKCEKYEVCKDIDVLLNVFGRTVGDLYIPTREMSFDNSKFQEVLYFLKSEVDS